VTSPSTTEIVVDGVRSSVLQTGPAERGEAVVFVHGNPGPGDDWSDLLDHVGSFARAIAPDMPGYGRADKPRTFEYTIAGYADHLAGVLDQLGVRRAHLVAHDLGGPWALAWAVGHPDAFASATLINTGALTDYRWHRYAKIWRTPILGELSNATTTRSGVPVPSRAREPAIGTRRDRPHLRRRSPVGVQTRRVETLPGHPRCGARRSNRGSAGP
jgi:pimeloyl-ACP methyl ester carboxylesterase